MIDQDLKAAFRRQAQAALSLNVAYIGVVNGLFSRLCDLGGATAEALAAACALDAAYTRRWCEAAYAFEYLDADGEVYRLTPSGAAMRPEAPESSMAMAVQSVLSAHMAERAAGLMRTGERPGERVLAERDTVLPWFGPMLESQFAALFEHTICPAVPVFAAVDARAGLVVDLGCGNGWYLRALARRFGRLRGLGIDGFEQNVELARRSADGQGLGRRLEFRRGDIHELTLEQPADLIAMNRALHHVWEKDPQTLFDWLRRSLAPGGHAVIWEPAWPRERAALRDPARRAMAFQNLSEHVQGNHFLRPEEIVEAFGRAGMPAHVHLFADGNEAVVVAQR